MSACSSGPQLGDDPAQLDCDPGQRDRRHREAKEPARIQMHGYALLLKRQMADPRAATPQQIEAAAWDTVPDVGLDRVIGDHARGDALLRFQHQFGHAGDGAVQAARRDVLGDESGYALTDNQKMKLAAIEAVWHTEPGPSGPGRKRPFSSQKADTPSTTTEAQT
jgi:hypothetical protein